MSKIDYSKFYDPYPGNILEIEQSIKAEDKVLDVGSWWKPLNRANVVIDILPYATRGGGGSIGQRKEYFTPKTWIQFDICSGKWPFKDKEFDFIHCGQTLEDVKDPLFVCKEMMRVGKRGVITTPTIWIECQKGIDAYPESVFYRGFDKHRWLVRHLLNKLIFIPKLSSLMAFDYVNETTRAKYINYHRIWSDIFFWKDKFEVEEAIFQGFHELKSILEEYFAKFDYEKIAK
jgi:ubiquinone/menaquinone biosynthesis C-methylase UbiE